MVKSGKFHEASRFSGFLFSFFAFCFVFVLLCWVFVAVHGFSLVAASRGYSPVVVHGVPIAVVPPVADHGPWRARVELWLADSVAPRPVGSSQTSGGARVPCSGGQILIHCTTREVPPGFLNDLKLGDREMSR